MKIDLVGSRGWLFLGSGIAVLVSLILLAIPPALVPGIEFTSGTTTLLRFERNVTQAELRTAYADLDHSEARIQSSGVNEYLIRTNQLEVPEGGFSEVAPGNTGLPTQAVGPQPLEDLGTVVLGAAGSDAEVAYLREPFNDNVCELGGIAGRVDPGTQGIVREIHQECGGGAELVYRVQVDDQLGYVKAGDTQLFVPKDEPEAAPIDEATFGERAVIEAELTSRFGPFEVLEFASVSPVVSRVAVRNASVAVVVASLFIMAYVAFAFASVPKPFRYATCAIVALVHDVVIVLGAFSLFGKLFGTEINLMFVTALLTVVGFSVHDSIVVFDRIRENVRMSPHAPLRDNVNAALVQTMSRSLNTSITLLLTVTAMLLLGGDTIRAFLLTILVGVIAGVYSSIGIAAQLLVAWEEGDFGRWMRRVRGGSKVETAEQA
ncbi:MAG: protein translocase subunit SecF [Chloroflexi bacterium]|nr:protein translocase subunit SecF [Chloroflexota bacterium]MDA1148218.1 protein translocase subunit SecF [Chloroflexota bacterium]MQC83219.1 protein translocase subunit SecF [Chloroflexota bacterium]